jgi:hypothetical protein
MAASVMITGNTVSIGNPTRLFRLPADAGGSGSSSTVTADHTRFIAVDDPHGAAQTFRVLIDWQGNRAR